MANGRPPANPLLPHVWQIADKAYRQIVGRGQNNQSIVISGESGSGKTENTKTMLGYLGALSQQNSVNPMQRAIVEKVNNRLESTNPILESFGNARTVRNDNSSRFGKYIKLHFDRRSGVMLGGEMVTYLLERSRIVGCAEGERCYHVFYEMLAGLSAGEKSQLGLKSARDYPSLMQGNTLTRRGVDGRELDDASEFRLLLKAMDTLHISATEQKTMWAVLAFILRCINEVKFTVDANDKAALADERKLKEVCQIIQVDPELVKPVFLVKSKTKILTTLTTKMEAEALRDSFCKALYIGVFNWIVERINKEIAPQTDVQMGQDGSAYIGVLDIFGFENFKLNSFEQLCINYANESLANHYNRFVFANDAAECAAEGIAVPDIEFPDNTEALKMFDARGMGIFGMLDEESYFKNGSAPQFTEKLWQQYDSHKYFIRPKSNVPKEFGVHHYACDTIYNTEGWLEKNSDPLKDEAKIAVQRSAFPGDMMRTLLDGADTAPSDGSNRKRTSVSKVFHQQLTSLRTELESTESNFIRCVKPNMEARPAKIDNAHVSGQLESAGVLQTIDLKRQGYPVRRTHQQFAEFFHSLGRKREMKSLLAQRNYRQASESILELYNRVFRWKTPHYAVGHNKVFQRSNVWGDMERTLLRRNRMRMKRCIPLLKRWVKSFRAKKAAEAANRQKRQLADLEQREGRPLPNIGQEKTNWFDTVSRLFPTMDAGLVFDVCGRATSERQAIAHMSVLRADEYNKHLPYAFEKLIRGVGLRESVIKSMVGKNIATIDALHNLTEDSLSELGLDEGEKKRLMTAIVQQESASVRNQRLIDSGTGAVKLSDEEVRQVAQEAAMGGRGNNDKVASLVAVLGCTSSTAADALRMTQGNESTAASMIMDGSVHRRSAGAAAGSAVGGSHAPLPSVPPTYSTAAHSTTPARPGMSSQNPFGSSSGAAGVGGSPAANTFPSEWIPSLNKMTQELGIDRSRAQAALMAHNGDMRAAIASVFG